MISSLLHQLAHSIKQYLESSAGKNATRAAVIWGSQAAKSSYRSWYVSLSPDDKQRVDAINAWALKHAIVFVARHLYGPVSGAIAKKAVELVMDKINEKNKYIELDKIIKKDKNVRKVIHANIDEKLKSIMEKNLKYDVSTMTVHKINELPDDMNSDMIIHMIAREKNGKNRTTAIEALLKRLEQLKISEEALLPYDISIMTVHEIRNVIDNIDNTKIVERLIEKEINHKNRTTAIEALLKRKNQLSIDRKND